MDHLKEHDSFLQMLIQTHPRQRRALIQSSTVQQLRVLTEIFVNILRGIIPLTSQHKAEVTRHAKVIRRLVKSKLTGVKRRNLLERYSHILPIVLEPIYPLLKEAIDN